MNSKPIGHIAIGIVLAGFILSTAIPALACGGGEPSPTGFADPQAPKAIVLAAFANLGQRLGQKLDPEVTPWQWEEYVFANTSLECAAPGQSVDSTLVRGYHVIISVPASDGTYANYFFHATKDGQRMFQCTKAGPGPQITVNS